MKVHHMEIQVTKICGAIVILAGMIGSLSKLQAGGVTL